MKNSIVCSDLSHYVVATNIRSLGGIQVLVRFPNGYGASIIRGFGTYGEEDGLWELAVIKWVGDKFGLTYDTPITHDVLGYLDKEMVNNHLREIKSL